MKKRIGIAASLAFLMLSSIAWSASRYAARTGWTARDAGFARKAAVGSLMEIRLGRITLERGVDGDVREFAQRMIIDHGQASQKLKRIARTRNVRLPAAMPANESSMVRTLATREGMQYDRAYIRHMVADHRKDVAMFRSAANSLSSSDLRAFAEETLPTLEEHLRMAIRTARALGIETDH